MIYYLPVAMSEHCSEEFSKTAAAATGFIAEDQHSIKWCEWTKVWSKLFTYDVYWNKMEFQWDKHTDQKM